MLYSLYSDRVRFRDCMEKFRAGGGPSSNSREQLLTPALSPSTKSAHRHDEPTSRTRPRASRASVVRCLHRALCRRRPSVFARSPSHLPDRKLTRQTTNRSEMMPLTGTSSRSNTATGSPARTSTASASRCSSTRSTTSSTSSRESHLPNTPYTPRDDTPIQLFARGTLLALNKGGSIQHEVATINST